MTEPTEGLLRWAAEALGEGAAIISVSDLHEWGPWWLKVRSRGGISDLVLRTGASSGAGRQSMATVAAALRVAELHRLATPRLVACDAGGDRTGVPAALETALPGSSAAPSSVSTAWLREAGAAIARVHKIPFEPQPDLPLRIRPTQVDDRAMHRRWATLYQASSTEDKPAVVAALSELTGWAPADSEQLMVRGSSSGLLQLADELVRQHERPRGRTVFVHGDVWPGNMLWSGETCTALIDWRCAGAGDPGVDLGELRMQMALYYGLQAPEQVLEGWQQESGREAAHIAYWDAVAALNTPTDMTGWPGFDSEGDPLDARAVGERRDAFIRAALDRLSRC